MATPSIDIQGLLQNSHNTGVSISDALFEKIDDSLSAGSTEFHWILSEKDGLISSDNGHGMTKDKLQQSCRLHSRTISSGERHGRFGIGSKNAEWILTNLEGVVIKLSSDGSRISQVTINYPNIMKNEETYEPRAHGIEEDSRPIWDKYAINPCGSGTITQMHIPSDKRSELNEMFANDAVTGLRFKIATTYCDALTKGIKISIQNGDTCYVIHPIDRLSSSSFEASHASNIQVQFKHESHHIEELRNTTTGEIVSHVLASDGITRTCLDNAYKNLVAVSDSIDLFEHIGRTKCSFAYSNNWNRIQHDDFEKNGIAPLTRWKEGVQMFRKKTNGTEIVRNLKMLKHIPSKPTTKGDKAAYKYHENTRVRAEFIANDKMDVLYNVQVNKSQVDEDLIDKCLWKTIERLRKTFVTECYKAFEPVKPANDSSQSVQVQSAESSPSLSPVSSPVSSSPPPVSEQLLPILPPSNAAYFKPKVNSNPKSNLTFASKERKRYISSDSESDSDNGIVASAAGAAGGGVANASHDVDAAADVPRIVPDSECDVGSSKHQYILRKTGENILAEWRKSGKYMAILDETLDKMHIEFSGKLAADTLKRYLKRIPFEGKYEFILELIHEKYPLPESRMKGIELQRIYTKTFEADAAIDHDM